MAHEKLCLNIQQQAVPPQPVSVSMEHCAGRCRCALQQLLCLVGGDIARDDCGWSCNSRGRTDTRACCPLPRPPRPPLPACQPPSPAPQLPRPPPSPPPRRASSPQRKGGTHHRSSHRRCPDRRRRSDDAAAALCPHPCLCPCRRACRGCWSSPPPSPCLACACRLGLRLFLLLRPERQQAYLSECCCPPAHWL
jgi:hypothetical protein